MPLYLKGHSDEFCPFTHAVEGNSRLNKWNITTFYFLLYSYCRSFKKRQENQGYFHEYRYLLLYCRLIASRNIL